MKVREWKKIYHVNINQRNAGVTILISDKVDFRANEMSTDREVHYIMMRISPPRRHSNPKSMHPTPELQNT